MSDRETIFNSIQSALQPLPERSPYPQWKDELAVSQNLNPAISLRDQFADKLKAASGVYHDSIDQLIQFLISQNATSGYCDPQLAYLLEGQEEITCETNFDMAKVDDYAFGITRASAGIAESGTIVLKDSETSSRLAALAPWVHIAVIKESEIVASIADAIMEFKNDPTIIFCTGPSKTADVEGILIEGVHGPGVQVALVIE